MKKNFSIPRGTADVLPQETGQWDSMETLVRFILGSYGYKEIRTPLFEETELFARSVGQTSDIVQKQMLNLAAQAGASEGEGTMLSLRPEGTASVVRSYIENHLDRQDRLSKVFYIGPMFRGERPQKGRLRQFHQIGVEAIGPESSSPYLDAEIIALCVQVIHVFGVKEFSLKLNTLGTPEDKTRFGKYLREALAPMVSQLCPDCQSRFERNVFRVLDCKQKNCIQAVRGLTLDYSYLSQESRNYFESVKAILKSLGIAYVEDPCLVRGLDYYTHTVFEISCPALGSQDALGAGGRYNQLVEQLGGPKADAMGFALGIERLFLAAPQAREFERYPLCAFIIALGDAVLPRAFQLLQILRRKGIAADMRFSGGSLKSQMRQADKSGAAHVLMMGVDELSREVVTMKYMKEKGRQEEISLEDIDGLCAKMGVNNK